MITNNVPIHKSSTTRLTSQKQAIIDQFTDEGLHLSAEDVYQSVRKDLPRISLGTVYRNLEGLADLGVLAKAQLGGVTRFELSGTEHYHALCLSCGAVENLDSNPATDIEEFFSRSTNYQLTGHNLTLYGLCPRCQKKR